MRYLGVALFLVGIGLAGTFAARPAPSGEGLDRVAAWADVAGVGFGVGALLMIAGGLIARRARAHDAASSAPTSGGAAADPVEAVHRIVEILDGLPEASPETADAIRDALDEVLEVRVAEVVDQKDRLIARFGLARFAEMMGHFALMERNAARAWSAIIDEVLEEVPPCIERARAGVAAAVAVIEAEDQAEA